MATKLLFHFEEPTGVMASDAMENLEDLGRDAALIEPTVVTAWAGRGRRYGLSVDTGHFAADRAGRDTLLQRDVTIQAILSLVEAGFDPAGTLMCRGIADGSAAERYSYGLELGRSFFEEAEFAGEMLVRFFWMDNAGTLKMQPAAVFKTPGDLKLFLLTATRRWERGDRVVCRYYVNDELIGEFESTDGDIGGGTTGQTTVGIRKNAGIWDIPFNGVIDELMVTDHEMSHEEVRHTYKRLTEHQPAGVAMFKGLVPPGLRWASNPGNNSGRRVKVAGQGLGLAIANTEGLRAMFLPDAMPKSLAPRWEKLCALSPRPRDSLDVRRARVVGFNARDQGFHLEGIQTALEGPLDTAGANIEILEFTNEVTDSFEAINSERWHADPPADWTIVANALRVTVAAGQDVRWENMRLGRHIRMSVDANGWPTAPTPGRLFVSAKITGYALQADVGAGILIYGARKSTGIWFGIFNNAGTIQLGYRKVTEGALGAWTSLSTPWATTPVWLRFDLLTPDALLDPNNGRRVIFSYSTVGPNAGFVDSAPVSFIGAGFSELEWAGFAAFGTSAAVGGGGVTMDFDDFRAFFPNGLRPFNWYAYRNPALAGDVDIVGGRLLAAKIKPAHTFGTVIENKSVLCDNARYGLCDRGPCGGV